MTRYQMFRTKEDEIHKNDNHLFIAAVSINKILNSILDFNVNKYKLNLGVIQYQNAISKLTC